jgi:hypothetical protein
VPEVLRQQAVLDELLYLSPEVQLPYRVQLAMLYLLYTLRKLPHTASRSSANGVFVRLMKGIAVKVVTFSFWVWFMCQLFLYISVALCSFKEEGLPRHE